METVLELLIERPEFAVGIGVAAIGGMYVMCCPSSSKTKRDKQKQQQTKKFKPSAPASDDHFRVAHSPVAGKAKQRSNGQNANQKQHKSKKQLAKERNAALKKADKKRRQREKKAKALAAKNSGGTKKNRSKAQERAGGFAAIGDDDEDNLSAFATVRHSPNTSRSRKKAAASAAQAKREAAQEALRKQAALNAADGWSTAGVTSKKSKNANRHRGQGQGGNGQSVAAAAADAQKAYVSIDSKKIGHVIGPKGSTLHKIQDVSGAKVDMPNRDQDAVYRAGDTSKVTLTGSANAIKVARRAILDICNKGYSTTLDKDLLEGYIKVDPSRFHEIYGRGGSTIRALQDKLDVRINVPKGSKGMSSSQISHRVGLVGEKSAVKKAKEMITLLLKQHYTPMTHPGFTHAEVAVPPEQFNLIIGVRGQTIKSIEGDTRCKVHIPGKFDETDNVVVVGPAAGVAKAAKRIMKLCEEGYKTPSRDE